MAGNAMTRGLRGRPERMVLLLALVCGAVAALLVAVALSSRGGDTGAGDGAVPVVVAKQAINPGTTITAQMLEVRQVPASVAVEGALRNIDLAVGRVARFPISAGEQVQARDVAAGATAGTISTDMPLSYVIPKGMRALSLPIEEATAAGGLIRPGDRVDVIGVFDVTIYGLKSDPTDGTNFEKYLTMTVLQDVEVLAVAQAVEPVVTADGQEGSGQAPRVPVEQVKPNPKAATLTLAVTPEQAQRLAWAQSKGELRVALRRFGDTGEVPVRPATDIDLMPQLLPPFARR